MKKTIEVAIPAIPAKTELRLVYTCDICEKTSYVPFRSCVICGRDICRYCGYDDPSQSGDYPDQWCRQCWDARQGEIEEAFRTLEAEYDEKTVTLTDRWRAKSLLTKE